MDNYTIAEEFELPSKGKVYSQKVNPIVKLKSMTTTQEMRRLSPSERPYKAMCDIIDECFVESPGISSYDMCLADYQYCLINLRIATYGTRYDIQTSCPYCGNTVYEKIDLGNMDVKYCDLQDLNSLFEFELPRTKKKIKINIQTPRIIDDVTVQNKALQKKSKGQAIDSSLLFNIVSLIETIDGHEYDPIQKEDFVRQLPMMDTNYIVKKVNKLVESFGVNMQIEHTCPTCGLDYNSTFRINGEFFGPNID